MSPESQPCGGRGSFQVRARGAMAGHRTIQDVLLQRDRGSHLMRQTQRGVCRALVETDTSTRQAKLLGVCERTTELGVPTPPAKKEKMHYIYDPNGLVTEFMWGYF